MARKRKAAIAQPTTIDRSKKLLAEPFTEPVPSDSSVGVDVVNVNDRGVTVLPKEISKRPDHEHGRGFFLMAMLRGGVGSTMMLIPICRPSQGDYGKVPSEDGDGSD